MNTKKRFKDLPDFVDHIQSQGRYSFSKADAEVATSSNSGALRKALWRLEDKKRIRMARRGFYLIVPLEYSQSGIIPAEWFIADLMKYLEQPYYVGLLSAAAIHGASHQQPQEFHVVVPRTERDIRIEGLQIRFFKKAGMNSSPTEEAKTPTGYMHTSDPAVTAIDLVAYAGRVGGLDRVLTVLQELSEKITPNMLIEASNREKNLSHLQRLGWLLEKAQRSDLAAKLADWISKKEPNRTPLDPALPRKGFPRDSRWNVVMNTHVEGEL
jgi:predicted transcriptional regulator of viral defense system